MNNKDSNFEIITPQKATRWLEEVNHLLQLKMQRELRLWKVHSLAEIMKKSQFTINIIHFCFFDDKVFCVNGQHTLHAIIEANAHLKLPVARTQCNSIEEVQAYYGRHDIQKIRLRLDIIRAYNVKEITGINNSYLSKELSAIEYFIKGFKSGGKKFSPYTNDELIQMTIKWAKYLQMFLNATVGGQSDIVSYMLRRSILSIILLTFKYQPDIAQKFWRQVAHDDGLKNNDPRKTLHRKFIVYKFASHEQKPPERELSKVVAITWNKFFHKQTLSQVHIQKDSNGKRQLNFELDGIDMIDAARELDTYTKNVLSFNSSTTVQHFPSNFSKISKTSGKYNLYGMSLRPVTEILKVLQGNPDWDKVIEKESERLGITPAGVKNQWTAKREKGTRVHKYIEEILIGVVPSDLIKAQRILIPEEIAFNEFWTKNKNEYQYDPKHVEWVIGEEKLKIGGTVDLYVQDLSGTGPALIDWKTGKFRTDGYNGQTLLAPFNDVPDSEWHRYSLQLSLYRLILERSKYSINLWTLVPFSLFAVH